MSKDAPAVPKFCINCRYHNNDRPNRSDECCAPQAQVVSPPDMVTGATFTTDSVWCYLARDKEDMCGRDAKWFQPIVFASKRKPWWRRLIHYLVD